MANVTARIVKDLSIAASPAVELTEVPFVEAEIATIVVKMTNAALAGDIGAVTVKPKDANGVVMELPLVVTSSVGPVLTGAVSEAMYTYDVRSLLGAEVSVANTAASARDLEIHIMLYRPA